MVNKWVGARKYVAPRLWVGGGRGFFFDRINRINRIKRMKRIK